jgi:acetolactate synthase-1/2/3 large subunit
VSTYKAKGIIPDTWPNLCGLLTGGVLEAPVLESADLLIGVGLDPIELLPTPWDYPAPLVVINESPTDLRYFDSPVQLVGSIPDLIRDVSAAILRSEPSADWRGAYDERRSALQLEADGLAPHEIVNIARRLASDATVTVDAGAHMLLAMSLWDAEAAGQVLISSGLATMGFALPAAIGAAVASDARPVVCLTGDGGLGMSLAELETAARLELPVVVVVFNDSQLSLIKIKQQPNRNDAARTVSFAPTDFSKIAKGFGVHGARVDRASAFEEAFRASIARDGPSIIDAVVDASRYREILEVVRGRG